jgi:hypothetical protein
MRKRKFFFATRVFEIARSLIYTEPTFLSQPDWIEALAKLRTSEGIDAYHPKEVLFDILPMISDLSVRAAYFCENIAQYTVEIQSHMIQSLANEGLLLQGSLQQWLMDTDVWETLSRGQCKVDIELLIGHVYYHAISIFLSGTFDYHIHWTWPDAPCAPILRRSQIDWHVCEILRLSQELLAAGVSGVLLFFALRVAGARAVDETSRTVILDLLHTTARRGFIVAEAFTTDLSELWASQNIVF